MSKPVTFQAMPTILKWGSSISWIHVFCQYLMINQSSRNILQLNPYRGGRYEPRHQAGLGFTVVDNLCRPHYNQGHAVYTDSFFTSPTLAHHMFDNGTHFTGTVTCNRRGMPNGLRRQDPERGQTLIRSQGPVLAVKFHDRRVFTILTTIGSPRYHN